MQGIPGLRIDWSSDMESEIHTFCFGINTKISLVMGFVVIRLDLIVRFGQKSTSQFPKY